MRSLFKISWREVTEGFARYILTVLSVSLGVAFLTGTLTLRDSLQHTLDDIKGLSANAGVYVVGTNLNKGLGSSVRRSIPIDYEHDIRTALGPGAVIEPGISTNVANIENAEGEVIRNVGAPTVVRAYYDDPRWGTLTAGRWANGPREVVVEETILEPNGLHVGDTTTLVLSGAARQVTIVGSVAFDHSAFGAVQVFMDRDVIEPIAVPDGKVRSFEIYLDEGTSIQHAITQIAKAIPADAVVMTKSAYAEEQFSRIDKGLGFVSVFLLVFVFLSVFIGSFVIANTFAMVVRQRMKQFAMLRAIGATPGGIIGLVLTQALVVGLVGAALGIGLGIGLIGVIGLVFNQIGLQIQLSAMTPTTMGWGLITGAVVTVAGAVMSARRAALADPLDVLRSATGAAEHLVSRRTWLGLAIAGLGALVAAIGANQQDATVVGYGAALVLLGVLGALTLLAGPAVRQLGRLFIWRWPVQARMAVGNILRNPKRTAATSGALVIGVALVIAGAMVSASLKGGSTEVVENNLKSDLVVFTGDGGQIPRAEADNVGTIRGVRESSPLYWGNAEITRDSDHTSALVLLASDRLTDYRTQTVVDGNPDALADGEILINTLRGEDNAYNVGDEITVTTRLGKKVGKVGALVEAPAMLTEIILPDDWVTELYGVAANPVAIDIKIDDEADLETVKRDINNAFVDHAPYYAATRDEVGGQSNARVDLILGILYALLALSVITAIFGIVNTLALSVMERVREIGMVRAVGMSRRGVMGMITIESVLMTIFGTIVGLAVGIGLAWALIQSLSNLGISRVVIPWLPMVGLVIGAMVVGVLAAVVPARQAAKINELQAMAE